MRAYQPKGSMCAVCRHNRHDCSSLPFNEMPQLEAVKRDRGNCVVVVVRCTKFKRMSPKE